MVEEAARGVGILLTDLDDASSFLGISQRTGLFLKGGIQMAFFASAVGVLQTLVIALGAGLAIWGVINLMEGYGNDNPGANAHVR